MQLVNNSHNTASMPRSCHCNFLSWTRTRVEHVWNQQTAFFLLQQSSKRRSTLTKLFGRLSNLSSLSLQDLVKNNCSRLACSSGLHGKMGSERIFHVVFGLKDDLLVAGLNDSLDSAKSLALSLDFYDNFHWLADVFDSTESGSNHFFKNSPGSCCLFFPAKLWIKKKSLNILQLFHFILTVKLP